MYSILGSVFNSENSLLIPRSVFNHYDVLNSCEAFSILSFDTVGHTLLQIQSIGNNFVETGPKLIVSYSLLLIVLFQHY